MGPTCSVVIVGILHFLPGENAQGLRIGASSESVSDVIWMLYYTRLSLEISLSTESRDWATGMSHLPPPVHDFHVDHVSFRFKFGRPGSLLRMFVWRYDPTR